ncbi:MAG: ABC transporter ATP-binding protein [Limnochordia bacterium]|jgi:ATP-binding cassette subfamily B protein|nr:ABC transporter ATP-binding protein [Bacillota bacterium]HOB09367.1 ABC transporter ATP-binding protein [Limnochordia bacterium]NLH31397.1 ABC transporter ATP-binding protein [Bacillota bacterium]HPT93352.1 ABC transporter ATP-binding protein [Limnochordia bacterium]HPZ30463.1 ABC transporter ATP-binding protein [Limnochordia bacterium]
MKHLRLFISYYKTEKRLFFIDMACATLIAVLDLAFPIITRMFMKDFIPNRNLQAVALWVAALVGLYLARWLCQYIVDFWGHVVGVNMEYHMRKDLFSHLQTLDFQFFDNTKVGHLMSRIVNDLREVTELAHHGPEDLFIASVMLIGSFVYLMSINVPLTLLVFAFIPIIVWYAYGRRSKMESAFTEERKRVADVNAEVENSLLGIRVVKSFVNEDYEQVRFDKANDEFKVARRGAFQAMAEYSSGLSFFTNLLNVMVLGAGAWFMHEGRIDLADLTAYLMFINYFLQPIRRLISFTQQYQQGMTGFARFVELMEVKPSITDRPGAVAPTKLRGDIVLEDVSFRYDTSEEVLEGISLSIPAGTTAAFVGPSGGGKTTLCHLIPRFYDVTKGAIYVDQIDVRDMKLAALRSQIGLVQQDVFLFTGTIRDNILYGRPDASEQEMIDAAKKAQIHDFVMTLPDGYDTYVGERGIKLSGGQKQRIAIARVFLKNPPILILDEATSALDSITEHEIQAALVELSRNRTTLIIAHRLSTIRHADQIYVIIDGKIREQGTHEELLKLGGLYRELYMEQYSRAAV